MKVEFKPRETEIFLELKAGECYSCICPWCGVGGIKHVVKAKVEDKTWDYRCPNCKTVIEDFELLSEDSEKETWHCLACDYIFENHKNTEFNTEKSPDNIPTKEQVFARIKEVWDSPSEDTGEEK